MSTKLSWGIISTGQIANCLGDAILKSQTGKLVAVASRSQEKAEQFGEKYKLAPAKRYTSYEAMLADKEIQAVYVATPHPFHAEWAIKAAEAGKNVLVEKPVALNQYQAQAMFEAAHANNVFVMEAFMYRCHPQTQKLVELLKEKAIGDVRVIQASFSFQAGFNAEGRLFKNALGGGGILDVGCYPASLSRLIAGAATGKDFADPVEVKAVGHLESTGIDGYAVAVLKFPGDIVAQIATGVAVNQENVCRIFGTEGRIFIPNPWVADRVGPDSGKIIINRNGEKEPRKIITASDVTSFTLEVDVFGDAVAAGKKQTPPPP